MRIPLDLIFEGIGEVAQLVNLVDIPKDQRLVSSQLPISLVPGNLTFYGFP